MQSIILPLKWDSDFFKLKIGKINYESLSCSISNSELEKFDVVYIEHYKTKYKLEILKNKLFHITFSDKKIIYQKKINKSKTILNENISIYPLKTSSKKLIDLSIQAGTFSRFKLDKKFKADYYQKLYAQWIKNSVQKKCADFILVYGHYKNPKGFITLVYKENLMQIGLLAVDTSQQNLGIGKALIRAAEIFTLKNNQNTLQVITQTYNKDACKFYEKQGFKKEMIIYTHHHWK